MHRFFIVLFIAFGIAPITAQIHEIGAFLGGSNYIGDIGPTTYIAPQKPAFGILYKWNRSPRHAWRASATVSKIASFDTDSKVPARKSRDYRFENELKEVSLGLEFNFFDFNLHDDKPKFTPYIYTGLSYLQYNGLFFVDGQPKSDSEHGTIAIPMILGLKGRIFTNFVLGFESGVRFSFADDIDGSNPSNGNLASQAFGNLNSKDWYVFTGLSLTYTFGEKPCYCAE
jgi:hypothetical protein